MPLVLQHNIFSKQISCDLTSLATSPLHTLQNFRERVFTPTHWKLLKIESSKLNLKTSYIEKQTSWTDTAVQRKTASLASNFTEITTYRLNVNKISARHAIIHEAANTICFQRFRDELSWKLQPLCTKFYDCVKTTSACTMRRDVWHAIKWKPKTIAIRLVNL